METRYKLLKLFALVMIVGCAPRPTLEELEDEAVVTGDWTAVERREEVMKNRLETTAPGCPAGHRKKCFEEHTGIQCYCLPSTDELKHR